MLKGCCPCPPCYSVEGCGEDEFFAAQSYEGSYPKIISNNQGTLSNGIGGHTSCISYQDAVNVALYEAMRASLYRLGSPNADWGGWSADTSNTEISATANCYCGWTGDPVTVTKEAGEFTDYWTMAEANAAAYSLALTEATDALQCTEPEL